MKFEKIIIPPGWQESFTKYPNGKTIFEALSATITTVNEGIEEVNQKVNQGLLAIDQAEDTIRQEITESFNTLKLQLESEIDVLSTDLIADFGLLQSQVLTLIADKANAADVYTKQQVDAQLAETENRIDTIITTPVPTGEIIAQEIVDARQGNGSVGANLTQIKSKIIDVAKFGKLAELHGVPSPTTEHFIGMDSEQRIYRSGAGDALERSIDGDAWENVWNFELPISGMRQLDNGELLVGLSDNYPTNTIKSALWLSSGYDTENTTWIKVLESDDYQQGLSLKWGFGGADNIYTVSEYDSKAPGARSHQQRVWLTQDYGVTWLPIYDHGTGGFSNRHIHGCVYDKYRNAIWVSFGDYTPGDVQAKGIIVSFDLGVTWTTVTNKHQPTSISVFPECVLFGSDNSPNGILRIDSPSQSNLKIEVAHKINNSLLISHVAERPYRLSDGFPLLIPFTTAVSDSGVVIATYDGYSFFELWKDTRLYNAKGPEVAFGPLLNGSYIIRGRDNDGFFKVKIEDINKSLIANLSRLGKSAYRQSIKKSYISFANSTSPFLTVPNNVFTEVVLRSIPTSEYDPSELFTPSADGLGITINRQAVVQIFAEIPFTYDTTNPAVRITLNGLSVATTRSDSAISTSVLVKPGDKISVLALHQTGVAKTLSGTAYCFVLDAYEI